MFQPREDAVPPMPRDLERGAHGAKRAATSRLNSALAGQGQHGPLKPGREPPSCQNEGVPVPTNASECHGLVGEECSWEGVRKAGRGLGEFVVNCGAEGAEEFGPEGARGEQQVVAGKRGAERPWLCWGHSGRLWWQPGPDRAEVLPVAL